MTQFRLPRGGGIGQGVSVSKSTSGENRIFPAPFKAERKIPCFLFGVVRALPPASIYFNH